MFDFQFIKSVLFEEELRHPPLILEMRFISRAIYGIVNIETAPAMSGNVRKECHYLRRPAEMRWEDVHARVYRIKGRKQDLPYG